LVEVITPKVVAKDDFVETEHLTTVLVVVPKGQEKELMECYENLDETVSKGVVPETAKQIGDLTDKDGNTLYRVVMFKNVAAEFKNLVSKQGSSKKFTCRDFTYDPSAHGEFIEKRKSTKAELDKLEAKGMEVCEQSFSDLFASWMHVKAMRVFVDSVLRFGLKNDEPCFTAFLAKVPSNPKTLGDCIANIADATPKILAAGEAEEDEYNGYVALPISPLIE
jgi:V-type H+-transporting ATPase subunit C